MKSALNLVACLVLCLLSILNPPNSIGQETERFYLSGKDKDSAVPWKFMCTSGAQAGKWTTIPVPSNWELHGFGTLNYKKDIGSALEERGLYERRFPGDPNWKGQRIFLVFEGVMTDTSVTLNGKRVGPTHQGGYYRFKYEITEFVKFGEENLLEVDVAKHSANESVNKAERTADYWVFGGIYRPVFLEIVPEHFIERIAINALADGTFNAEVFTNGPGGERPPVHLEAEIESLDGKRVGKPVEAPCVPQAPDEPTILSTKIDSPRQWSAETPNLYQAEFRLVDDGKVVHRLRQRFGFQTIEVRREDGIYVNGRRVILKGVNRHSTWPDSGRCLSNRVHRLDIETIQAMNMNAVRMSHYPPDQEFLDLCDELGLYVLDELAGWHWHYDTQVGRKLVEEMVARDVNHPSIIFWDNGNEGGNNVALDEVFGWYDPQKRAVLHPWEVYKEINTAHYLTYDRAKLASIGAPTRHGTGTEYQEWEDLNDPTRYIYMPTEMLHGLYDGGGGAGLEDYWNMMRQSPVLGGAFLWVLFDEGIRRPDGVLDCAGNQAPDGIVGPYREREASFYTIKQLWSPIQITLESGSLLSIKNDYSFTDAKDCQLHWQLRRFRTLDETEDGYQVLAEGKQPLPHIAPGKSGKLKLELPAQQEQAADALSVRVDDPRGKELWTWVWALNPEKTKPFQGYSLRMPSPITLEETPDTIIVQTGDLKVSFDRKTGLLREVIRAGQDYSLTNGPVVATGESKLLNISSFIESECAIIKARFSGSMQELTWRVRSNGWVDCSYAYTVEGEQEYFGVTFDYPQDLVQSKRWLGDGPFRVWKNRRAGVTLNVWQNQFNDTITGYSEWNYPEFKGCFSNVGWMQLQTREGPIAVVPHSRDAYLQVLKPSQPPKKWRGMTDYSLPDCGLALLDAIPPVGSKFKPADSTGPSGQRSSADGTQNGGVSFFFGKVQSQ